MKYLLTLAFKNVVRYKRRTLLTSLVLAFGIMIFIVMAGLLKGFDDKSFENQIQFETGDFKIRNMAYNEDEPFNISNFILNYRETENILNGRPYVKGYTERLNFSAELDNGKVSSPVIVTGINPEREDSVFTTSNFIVKGGLEKDGAVLGESLAKDMKLRIGDQVFVTFRNMQGTVDSVELNVSGIINAPDPQVNNATVYMNIFDAQKYLNTAGVTELVLKTGDYKKYKNFEPDLVKNLPGMKVYNWEKLGEDFIAIGQTKSKAIGMLLFFIAVIAVIGIINTMLMSVLEKKKEIGTLKALGMEDREVQGIFVYEGLLIGVLGNIIGIAAGVLLNLYLSIGGMDITSLIGPDIDVGYKVMGVVKSGWDTGAIFRAIIVSLAVSVISSYYPARKATKLHPAECLRSIQ